MADKYKGIYRNESSRLKGYDYGENGMYFITICTNDKQHFFGNVSDGLMKLSELGKIAHDIWMQIPDQFPFIELANFVIMPNHTHGILNINKSDTVRTRSIASPNNNNITAKNNSQDAQQIDDINGGITKHHTPMFYENISRIIRWYKGRCTFEMRKINKKFFWQSSFHDHIIRDEKSFNNIQNYIFNNPKNWVDDKFHP